jgi:hypothetical protein
MPKLQAMQVMDAVNALHLLDPAVESGPERHGFFNPFNRVVHVEENGWTYGFGPGHNYCTDPVLAEKLKSVADRYGIKVL